MRKENKTWMKPEAIIPTIPTIRLSQIKKSFLMNKISILKIVWKTAPNETLN
jgi:hypothetical protein